MGGMADLHIHSNYSDGLLTLNMTQFQNSFSAVVISAA